MNKSLQRILTAAALVAAQLLLFNNLQLRGLLDAYVAPCVYILYLIVMPVGASHVRQLVVGAALGLAVDVFSGTLGMNMAACVLLGFLRPEIIKALIGTENVDATIRPTIYSLGYWRWLGYAAICALMFHLVLFLIEVFSLHDLPQTLLRTVLSTAASLLLMMLTEIFFEKKTKTYRL